MYTTRVSVKICPMQRCFKVFSCSIFCGSHIRMREAQTKFSYWKDRTRRKVFSEAFFFPFQCPSWSLSQRVKVQKRSGVAQGLFFTTPSPKIDTAAASQDVLKHVPLQKPHGAVEGAAEGCGYLCCIISVVSQALVQMSGGKSHSRST